MPRYLRSVLLLAAALVVGCSATVGDLSDLTEDVEACRPGGNPNELRDFDFEMIGMTAHVTDLFEMTVINATSGGISSRIIYDALAQPNIVIHVPSAVPPGAHYLDFYGDLDQNGVLSPIMLGTPGGDHTWRRDICDDGSMTFEHLAVFEAIGDAVAIGGNMRLVVGNIPRGPGTIGNGALEMRVIADFEVGSQTVGVYRRTRIEGMPARQVPLAETEELIIPEILDGRTPHRIYYFFDIDADGVPDPSMGEIICELSAIADPVAGIDLTVDMLVERAMGHCMLEALPDP